MTKPITDIDKFASDAAFDSLYSLRAQQLSAIHWTPLQTVKKAALHLTGGSGKRILDIGSGVGKFCIIAAHYFPAYDFYGVEQRKALIDEAIIAQNATGVSNAKFIHDNFTALDPDDYDHFYFYNSFSENIYHYKPIDNLVNSSVEIYQDYIHHFHQLLEAKPQGTRLATFHCQPNEVPPGYKRIQHITGEDLKLWIKQ